MAGRAGARIIRRIQVRPHAMTLERIPPPPIVLDPQATRTVPADPAQAQGQLRAGTYNLAGANDGYNGSCQIEATTRTLAQQVVGGVDVVALQEVDVGTNDAAANLPAGIDDYNEYVLAQVSAEEQGLQGAVDYTRTETVASDGTPVVVIAGEDAEGRTSRVTISREHYAQDGRPTEPGLPGLLSLRPAVVTVYNADVQSPDGLRDYTVAYGESKSRDDGTFGNAVLLGPRAGLQRDADGNALVTLRDLGANDPAEDGEQGENRTALQVDIDVAGGSATVFSTHLTYSKDSEGAQDAREQQYATLAGLAEASGGNTLLLGDFNDASAQTVGPLTGEDGDENRVDPLTKALSDRYNDRDDTNIDRIFVSDDVAADGREERIFDGGSDHEMVSWNIDLDP